MRNIKKTLALLLCLATTLSSATAFAYNDVAYTDKAYEAIYRLGDLGIVSGYGNGNFGVNNTITRAEFARIIVSALGKNTEAKSMGFTSAFFDVAVSSSWCAPYVNYVSSQNIVLGYPDGSFQPNKTISFAECLTIILRVLEYKEDTVGYYWPNNYIDAAKALGISDGMNYAASDAITRGDAAVMIDRALFSDLNGQTDKTLLEKAGYTVVRDIVVVDSANGGREVRLSDSKTYTSKMTFGKEVGFFADYAVLDKNSNLVALKADTDGNSEFTQQMSVYVNAVTDNTISYVSNGKTGSYTFTSGFEVYADGSKQTFLQAKGSIKAGTDITFYGEGGGWSFAVIGGEDVEPVIARKNYTTADTNLEGMDIKALGLTVYRDGKAATISDICSNDVVYYNTRSNVMDVYSKKVTGIYYDAQPSKSFVETVTVGGKSYEIGFDAAAQALGANANSYEIGERVTLLLGKDGKAVFATELSDSVYENYGVVIGTGTQIAEAGLNEGATEIYADIFMPDGQEHRIITITDYKHMIGQLVNITYENSKAKLILQQKKSGQSGSLDVQKRTLNGTTILKDAVVIQRNSYTTEKSASCQLLNLDTMTAKRIDDNQLLNTVAGNAFGDIAIIYIQNVESTASFGIVSGIIKSGSGIGGYKIYSNGTEKSYNTSFTVSGLSVRNPVLFSLNGTDSDTLKKLFEIANGTVAAADTSRIKVGNNVYSLSPDVQIIDISDLSEFSTTSIDDIISGRIKNRVTLYSDTSASSACVIRIITIG
ncbi:MAG: S-layer homology domain-containing protein [Eubacteriales bacterium]|nr:S-layer homology domain-containing protein [Eubacteriales bacterium]